ncbi:MAG: adenylate/guanylate cyclase domain-containing protein [Proteobacteria bacterium]|nr:adenylate/guanylate cyclase domain-containing protein [Pseudomonadota bacterium]
MAEERVQRRLAAILAADVVGYSRLMGMDEAGTRARFNAHLNELIEPAIESRRGRIVKTTGDGLLVEFASVVDAVECAVAIQKDMAGRNTDEPTDQRIEFRIGVNLGDVIIEGDDIHGDGVNIAARLEGLSEPGGLCVSGKVVEEIRNKLDLKFEDRGEQTVKNIARPLRVYAVSARSAKPTLRDDDAEALPLPSKPVGPDIEGLTERGNGTGLQRPAHLRERSGSSRLEACCGGCHRDNTRVGGLAGGARRCFNRRAGSGGPFDLHRDVRCLLLCQGPVGQGGHLRRRGP